MYFNRTVLDSGITVISETLPHTRSIALGLWFGVGTRDESADQAGLAHFMEHMMFKGTPTKTPLDISMHFDGLGAELNAFTSKETTCYYARFADDKLADALPVLADMVTNSLFDDQAITTEREVVLEEISRSEDTPDDYVYELFSSSLMKGHELGLPVLGNKASVASFTHADCMRFHGQHYNRANLCVAASGNIDHNVLVSLVEEALSDLPQGAKTERAAKRPSYTAGHFIASRDIEQAHIIYGFPGLAYGDPDRFALSLLTCTLGGSMASRLFQEVREKRGLAYSIYAGHSSYLGAGQWYTYAGTRPDNIGEVTRLIGEELQRIAQEGIQEDELARNTDLICGQLILGLESTSSHMARLGRHEVLGLKHMSVDEIVDAYHQVTQQQIQQLAQRLFAPRPSIAIISPFTEDDVEKRIK